MNDKEFDAVLQKNLGVFFSECEERLAEAETALLELENNLTDEEVLNTLFRAIHTVKGSAGMFGFSEIVEFTHVFENILSKARTYILPVNEELIELSIKCNDCIKHMVEAAEQGATYDSDIIVSLKHALLRFEQNHGVEDSPKPSEASQSKVVAECVYTNIENYHLSIRTDKKLFESGYSGEKLFSALKELGDIKRIKFIDQVPKLEEMDPCACYMAWEVEICGSVDREEIDDLLNFIFTVSAVVIDPSEPQSGINEFKEKVISKTPNITELLKDFEIYHLINRVSNLEAYDNESVGLEDSFSRAPAEVHEESKFFQNKAVVTEQDTRFKSNNILTKNVAIKVNVTKLDKLVNLIGELVMVGSRVRSKGCDSKDLEFLESLDEMAEVLEFAREAVMELRMVPVGDVLSRFDRLVRDLSKELDKKVKLEIVGGETELDKTMVDLLTDPLTHMIRNSLDHGVEPTPERKERGKAEQSILTIRARHSSNSILIDIEDDGRGLDCEKIRTKAIDNGLIKEDAILSEQDILSLIFLPGFSTSSFASEISGRGVGMDVVKRNIERLRGHIQVKTKKGKGTCFSIMLPLTLAIIDGFHVRVGQEDFIIPLDSIVECVAVNKNEIRHMEQTSIINLRGEALPVCFLEKYLKIDHKSINNVSSLRKDVVIVNYGDTRFGLLVDVLLGEVQTVVKPLGSIFNHMKLFSGFTVLGDGQVAIIFDIGGLSQKIDRDQSVLEKNNSHKIMDS